MKWLVAKRWPDGIPMCPTCGRGDATYLPASQKWQCKSAHKSRQFSARVGTIFEDSPIPLEKWLVALWMACNCKNGVSSWEIHRTIGVTQKSAWFMLHRIRLAMQGGSLMKIGGPGGTCEADETVIGGKLKNMHRSHLKEMGLGQFGGYRRHQACVMGILDRDARQVRAAVIPAARREPMEAMVQEHVAPGTTMITDAHVGYDLLKNYFPHEVINHMEAYVKGKVHTNGIENFWSLLKRGLNGTYIAVEPFHLFRYVDEQVFRYNNRKTKDRNINDGDRFEIALSQVVGKRLTFAEVTGKVGATPQ
ncbi:MAG: IS1595 family transposase [Candidatus Korobacteraceae bacterium]